MEKILSEHKEGIRNFLIDFIKNENVNLEEVLYEFYDFDGIREFSFDLTDEIFEKYGFDYLYDILDNFSYELTNNKKEDEDNLWWCLIDKVEDYMKGILIEIKERDAM